jgi:outer membrane lipoprotein SlyB
MIVRTGLMAALCAVFMATTACTGGLTGSNYPRSEVGVPAEVRQATVIGVRQVQIDANNRGAGALGGVAAGGALGSTIGGGTEERVAAGIAGAILGGLAGAAIERGVTTGTGYEYTVKLRESGQVFAITQGDETPVAGVGQSVNLVYADRVRVVPN